MATLDRRRNRRSPVSSGRIAALQEPAARFAVIYLSVQGERIGSGKAGAPQKIGSGSIASERSDLYRQHASGVAPDKMPGAGVKPSVHFKFRK